MRARKLITVAALAIAVGGTIALFAIGGDEEADEGAATVPAFPPPSNASSGGGREGADDGATEAGGDPGPSAAALARREALAAYRAYVQAIGERDGESLCGAIAPGFERELRPPVRAGDCARRLRESIGYEDPRGFPVWEATDVQGVESVTVEGDTARVTATIVTAFADREQPSIESDVAYLERRGGSWRLAKASAALHRAVGKPDIPPDVISPP